MSANALKAAKSEFKPTFDVEFSLALNNRTGKYFVCRDMIDDLADRVAVVRYWRSRATRTPTGLVARVMGRLMTEEFVARTRWPKLDAIVPHIQRSRPVIFTDPLQVLFYETGPLDVVICHDLGPITHPAYYAAGVEAAYAKVFAQIARTRPRLIFVSESSKLAFEALYGAAYSRAFVVYPAIRPEAGSGPLEPVEGLTGPYLLTVGAVGARKNQCGAIAAFERSGLAGEGYKYVIVGGPEPGYATVADVAKRTKAVCLLGYASDNQLRWLYANANGFVLPSHLEGFGFPAAEAIGRGLVPVVSAGGALEEITGEGAILVDPNDIDGIAAGLRQLVSLTPGERSDRLSALSSHIAQFSAAKARRAWRLAILDEDIPPAA